MKKIWTYKVLNYTKNSKKAIFALQKTRKYPLLKSLLTLFLKNKEVEDFLIKCPIIQKKYHINGIREYPTNNKIFEDKDLIMKAIERHLKGD